VTPSDLFSIAMVLDPQISPDAGAVYFRRTILDRETDTVTGSIWRVIPGHDAAPFTSTQTDRSARVSPDGTRLAFLSERDGATRLMIMPTGGGEARTIGDALIKPGTIAWSPDGTRIAVVSLAGHDAASARCYHDEATGARHIRALPFKSDSDGLLDGRRKHLSIVDAAGGATIWITQGDFDIGGISWSPDGAAIAFAATIGQPEFALVSDIHIVDLATRECRLLTAGRGAASNPSWSNDGATIAFLGHIRGNDLGGRFNTELFVVPAAGGPQRSLSEHVDRTAGDVVIGDMRPAFGAVSPVWSSDDRELFVQISDSGTCGVRAFALDGSAVRIVAGGDRDVFAFSVAGDGTLAFAYSTPVLPADLALIAPGGDEQRLTTVNADFLATRFISEPIRYHPASADETVLDAWLLQPQTASATHPLVLQVHGGPHTAYGCSFFFEFQLIAGTGCAVAYGNPRGSQAYGQGYADAITGDWGGIDAVDLHAILDAALSMGSFDPKRVGVAGGSYGGFMTSWLLGHSDRFAAGVSMRAVNDFVSEVGASDLGWFLETEIDAPAALADGGRKLFDQSPIRAAAAIDAPLLIMHSERDFRCPIDQGEQLFTILRRLGKTQTEFVRFTGDGHELSRGGKPRNRVLRLRAIAHWFLRHLRPAGEETTDAGAGSLFAPLAGEADAYASTASAA
jgi:dipeptidyl aminopeptidase/acylaminoacyl peptidase